eukprot:9326745-Pyramimonas_sp.AAC.1
MTTTTASLSAGWKAAQTRSSGCGNFSVPQVRRTSSCRRKPRGQVQARNADPPVPVGRKRPKAAQFQSRFRGARSITDPLDCEP